MACNVNAYLQPFPPPVIALGTHLWWTCTPGLQLATLQVAAWHPVQLHRGEMQQQLLGSPGKARQGHSSEEMV